MNEITRIHIAKIAYDSEIAAKKQLEKYLHSLESYTQDKEVIADIEIRITELLSERGVAPGGVITNADVTAVRAQLGEPYEFADDGGDIAVGTELATTSRRLYRSPDNAVLGGVLSGIAAYFNVNPMWTRLIFILSLFVSFGLTIFAYIVLWIVTPPARTATEKLQLAGRNVTVASIKELNADEGDSQPNRIAPVLQTIFAFTFGSLSALAAIGTLIGTVWFAVSGLVVGSEPFTQVQMRMGFGDGNLWVVWVLFWLVILGLMLLASLFGLIAYAFFAKKLTKRMVLSGVVIIVVGIVCAATVVGVAATQSVRVATESRSMMKTTKTTLPGDFSAVTSLKVESTRVVKSYIGEEYAPFSLQVRYIVDAGPARYELSALPNAKVSVKLEGAQATIGVDIPESFRNTFVNPTLTIYGQPLTKVETKINGMSYEALSQESITVVSQASRNILLTGSYKKVSVEGSGTVDLGSSSVTVLDVVSKQNLQVHAGTVRDLTIVQPDVCPNNTASDNTSVIVAAVTSGKMTVNGVEVPAKSVKSSCASIKIGDIDDADNYQIRSLRSSLEESSHATIEAVSKGENR